MSLSEQPSSGAVKYGDNVNMAFFSQESSQNLNYKKTIWEEINAVATNANDQEKRNLLGAFLFSGDDIYKPISDTFRRRKIASCAFKNHASGHQLSDSRRTDQPSRLKNKGYFSRTH